MDWKIAQACERTEHSVCITVMSTTVMRPSGRPEVVAMWARYRLHATALLTTVFMLACFAAPATADDLHRDDLSIVSADRVDGPARIAAVNYTMSSRMHDGAEQAGPLHSESTQTRTLLTSADQNGSEQEIHLWEPSACGPSRQCCGLPAPVVCPRWEASLDFLYLKAHQRGLDFAVSTDGSAATLGAGQVHNLDYDRDFGLRGTLGYRTKTAWTLRFSVTDFDTDGVAYAERPADPGRLFVTRSQPDGSQESETARAVSSFDYTLFDLLAERPVFENKYAQVDIFGGVRFVDVRQSFQYDLDGRDFANGLILDRTNMDGFGLRLGGQGRWQMARGISLFGRIGVGLTYGRFNTSLYESNLDDTFVITDLQDSYDQAIVNIDAQLGLSKCWGPLRVGAGYEMANWLNMAERAMFTEDIQRGTYAPISQDILLEGLFVQFEYVR